mmetsp:Transcript_21499/g.72358  ORF Transcript_21499/g.72358 Transcript_21499/m.72358 type:complete len:282 (+) Transcript_21499:906-1751(+)
MHEPWAWSCHLPRDHQLQLESGPMEQSKHRASGMGTCVSLAWVHTHVSSKSCLMCSFIHVKGRASNLQRILEIIFETAVWRQWNHRMPAAVHHRTGPKRPGGSTRSIGRPTMLLTGSAPNARLSVECAGLSPSTHTVESGIAAQGPAPGFSAPVPAAQRTRFTRRDPGARGWPPTDRTSSSSAGGGLKRTISPSRGVTLPRVTFSTTSTSERCSVGSMEAVGMTYRLATSRRAAAAPSGVRATARERAAVRARWVAEETSMSMDDRGTVTGQSRSSLGTRR